MKKVKNQSSFAKLADSDVCVWPFAGGTPSGDAAGTTLLNTNFSDTYQTLYTGEMLCYLAKRADHYQKKYSLNE